MNKYEIKQRLEDLDKQQAGIDSERADLLNELENIAESESNDQLYFKKGETAWFVELNGVVNYETYNNDFISESTNAAHRFFRSGEMADMFAAKTQMIANCLFFKELHDREYTETDSFRQGDEMSYVAFDYIQNCYAVFKTCCENNNAVFFSTPEIAQKCADWLNGKSE
ncbi:MAG: hypothetical protein IJ642_00550 [Oscillospiraceae bacterium]|nr:hypothetical protein [Oscillospiraceae bacterium]